MKILKFIVDVYLEKGDINPSDCAFLMRLDWFTKMYLTIELCTPSFATSCSSRKCPLEDTVDRGI